MPFIYCPLVVGNTSVQMGKNKQRNKNLKCSICDT